MIGLFASLCCVHVYPEASAPLRILLLKTLIMSCIVSYDYLFSLQDFDWFNSLLPTLLQTKDWDQFLVTLLKLVYHHCVSCDCHVMWSCKGQGSGLVVTSVFFLAFCLLCMAAVLRVTTPPLATPPWRWCMI